MQGQHNIFLVNPCQGDEGFGMFDPFLFQKFLIAPIAVDYDGFRQQDAELLAALLFFFDNLDINPHLEQLACQIVGGAAASHDQCVADLFCLESDVFEKYTDMTAGRDNGDDVSFQTVDKAVLGHKS